MKAVVKTKAGQAEIAANEPGVVPGVVRVKVGLFSLFFSPDEADEAALAINDAALWARIAARKEKDGA